MKGKSKRIVSGFLSALTIISSIMQPVTTYAAEAEPAAYEAEYPDMEKVKGALAEDEIVTAEDYEVEAGTGFDVKSDFSGMKIHPEKVKVTYHEAKNQNGQAFDGNKADTYHAVYFVEPVSGHPSYHVQRNIVVREPSAEIHKEKNAQDSDGNDQTGGEDAEEGETDSHKKKLSETELNQALEALKGQDTYDEESGLKLLDVMEQFKNHMIAGNVDLLALEEGETVTFTAYNPKMLRSSQVEVSSGGWYYYADYGLGSYLTCPFTVKFGSVTATAYCIQPSKPGPGSGVYEITKLGDGKELSKVCYYGTNASGEDCFFDKKYPDFSAGKRFVVTHLAASYAEGSEDAFYGANDTGIALAKELYSYAVSQPEIPDAAMAFSDDKVTAYVDGNIQRTKEVTFQADSRQSITMKLPKGVKFHNVSTGKISNAGADVVVKGGTTFFLSAPLTQTEDVGQNWSAKMKGSITKDYSAYKITTGSDTQNLALVFGEGIEEETTASFQVTWLELAKVQVVKVDSEKEDAKLSGAVFGIYKDKNCTQLIKEMPKTDKNGTASVEIVKTQDTVYLKEITAPTGYRINTSAYNVKLVANQSTSVTVPDKEQLGELTVYKEGQVLTGADLSEKGIVFRYEKRRQKGAVYSVYAGEDIMTAYGAQVYKKGELVKEHLVTGDNGAAVLKNLHLGTYIVKEMQAPENFYNAKEEKTVTLSYAGQNAEAVFSETTFINDRQKAKVSVVKKDKDTEKPLDGGIFGLYAGNDIVNADGIVVVKKGSLIEKAVTGEDGTAIFTADLPIGNSYYVKEEQAPSGYQRNKEDIYSFKFSYTNDSEADVSFSHTFVNERVTAKIFLKKKDAETNKAEPQGDATLEKAVYGLENGFDKGAMEAIQEYLAEKGMTWEPEHPESEQGTSLEKNYPPVYPHTLSYAMEHGAADDYLDSRKLNLDCKNAIEEAIKENFDGMHLAQETAEKVLEAYGAERISFVLANTIQKHSYDGRYSRDNKAWAETIQIPENVSRGTDLNADYIVNSHPAVLDGFVNLFRKAGQEMNHEQEMGQNDIWNLSGQETELAYQAEDRFLFIQDTEGGYDYTFYGMDYREIDGGIYEDSDDMTIEEAAGDLLAEEGYALEDCTRIDCEELQEKTEKAAQEEIEEARHSLSASDGKEPEPKISFYVAECTEFHILGEYHEDLSLQEAAELYQTIPADRMNGIKGIGFRLEDGSIYDGTYELMTAGKMQTEFINEIPHYRDSPLVQQAIVDMEKILDKWKEKELT